MIITKKIIKPLILAVSMGMLLSVLAGCGKTQQTMGNYDDIIKKFPQLTMISADTTDSKNQTKALTEMISQNLKINIKNEPITFKERIDKASKGQYQICYAAWAPDYNDPMTFLDMWMTGNTLNDAKYSSTKYDELLKNASLEMDPSKRMDLMSEAEKLILNDAATSPILFQYRNHIKNPKLKGEIISPFGADPDLSVASKEDSKEVSFSITEEPPTLDTSLAQDSTSISVTTHITEGLTRLGKDRKPVPGIAATWDINSKYTEYTFHLRDAKWSNGDPVTANDFAYAWLKALNPDPNIGGPYAYILYPIKNAEEYSTGKIKDSKEVGIHVIDSKTLKVTLKQPVPYFLDLTTFVTYMPQNQKFVESHTSYASNADSLLYNGPFAIKSWDHGKQLVLKRNSNYWNVANVGLDKLNIIIEKDPTNLINMFYDEKLDIVSVPASKLDEIKAKGILPTRSASGSVSYIEFNCNDSVLKNAKIRKAISIVINRQEYIDNIVKDGSLPAYGFVPDIIPGKTGTFRSDYGDILPYDVQIDEAKKLVLEGMKELGLN